MLPETKEGWHLAKMAPREFGGGGGVAHNHWQWGAQALFSSMWSRGGYSQQFDNYKLALAMSDGSCARQGFLVDVSKEPGPVAVNHNHLNLLLEAPGGLAALEANARLVDFWRPEGLLLTAKVLLYLWRCA